MQEQQIIEWKESWRDEYLKWICGFANAQGSNIYIGKNDKGKDVGIDNAKRLLNDISNKEYQSINNVSKRTATNDLTELVEKYKILNKIGTSGAGIYYKLMGH